MTDNAITRNAKQLAALADKIEASERTGCSCCDPTSDSPDPVVQRLEREIVELKHLLRDQFGFDTFVALRDMYDKAKSNEECAEILRLYCKDGDGFWRKAGKRP